MPILPIFSVKLYLIVFIVINIFIDVSLIKWSFLARILHQHNVPNKGMVISNGKLGTLIGFDTCQDGKVK